MTEEQNQCVQALYGPKLVLAGPGSGKTTVLTHRLLYMCENGIKPESILVFTFTRAAAREMKERYKKLAEGFGSGMPRFGTFHAIFYEWLKEKHPSLKLMEEDEAREFVECAIKPRFPGELKSLLTEHAQDFLSAYQAIRNVNRPYFSEENKDSETYGFFSCCKGDISYANQLIDEYENYKKRRGMLDYEDMQSRIYIKISTDRRFLANLQARYRFFMVDEYQDINPIQLDIVKLLASKSRNLFAVGDEDQSIYGFRGSAPQAVFDFEKEYPDCERFFLSRNFRSTSALVNYTQNFIRNNQKRVEKALFSAKEGGAEPSYYHAENEEAEARLICDGIEYYRRRGFAYTDMAVLYRTHSRNTILRQALNDVGIPYTVAEEKRRPTSWQKLFAALADLYECSDNLKASRVIYEKLGLADYIAFDLPLSRVEEREGIGRTDRVRCDEIAYVRNHVMKMPFPKALWFLWRKGYFESYLRRYCDKKRINKRIFFYMLEQTVRKSAEMSPEEWRSLVQSESIPGEEGVRLMTMHGAKGLEFPLVWCMSLSKGIVPHALCSDVEEERRILYVAMTRAKEQLILSDYDGRTSQSLFRDELTKGAHEFP